MATINGVTISLVKLASKLEALGYAHEVEDIKTLITDLVEDDEEKAKAVKDFINKFLANSVGLRENNIHEYVGSGHSVEPVFFDSGDLTTR